MSRSLNPVTVPWFTFNVPLRLFKHAEHWRETRTYFMFNHLFKGYNTCTHWTLLVPVISAVLILWVSTKRWKHFSEFLVHLDMIASRSCCTVIVEISRSTTSERPTRSNGGVQWSHRHVQETSSRWFKLYEMVRYPAGSQSSNSVEPVWSVASVSCL